MEIEIKDYRKGALACVLVGAVMATMGGVFATHLRGPLSVPMRAEPFDGNLTELQIRQAPKDAEVIFLGDSLTERWRFHRDLWDKSFNKYRAVNLGVSGYRVANLLWLVNSGKLSVFHPKVFVVMIGTNDIGGHPPRFLERRIPSMQEVQDGITAIVRSLKKKFPEGMIIVVNAPQEPSLTVAGPCLEVYPFSASDLDTDSVHLNDHGYEMWASKVSAILGMLLPKQDAMGREKRRLLSGARLRHAQDG